VTNDGEGYIRLGLVNEVHFVTIGKKALGKLSLEETVLALFIFVTVFLTSTLQWTSKGNIWSKSYGFL
jgi:hypothetical protein